MVIDLQIYSKNIFGAETARGPHRPWRGPTQNHLAGRTLFKIFKKPRAVLMSNLVVLCSGRLPTTYEPYKSDFKSKRGLMSSVSLPSFSSVSRITRAVYRFEYSTGYALTAGQVRSGMGAYAVAARRRVHLATVLPRPPSGHRPGRRQARHARILQIGLHLTQPRSVWAPLGMDQPLGSRKNPMGGILRREARHMPIEA